MKKIFAILAILAIITVISLTGCNKQMIDTSFSFNKAKIYIGDEVISIDVKSWNDYEGEQLQIISKDGTVYLTNSTNVILIKE